MAEGERREPDYRFTLANERTFLAWLRTALALMAAGVAVVQLVSGFGGLRHVVGIALAAGGTLLAAAAIGRWRRVQGAMGRGEVLPPTRIPLVLGAGLAVLGVVVAVLLLSAPA